MGVAKYWIEQGADGWRLDVPNEINDDCFWQDFRQVVKSANSEAYLLGEIWTPELRWVGEEHFDGLMNYPLMDAIIGLLGSNTLDIAHFAEKVEGLLAYYRTENVNAMYNPVGSHDTERILTRMRNNIEKTKLATIFQFAYPGVPAIYYGDEIGLTGGKDPGCRGAFIWEESRWNRDLRNLVKTLIRLRKNHAALTQGEFRRVKSFTNDACYAFLRKKGDDQVLVIMNASSKDQIINIRTDEIGWEDGTMVKNLILPTEEFIITNHTVDITLPPWGGVWLG